MNFHIVIKPVNEGSSIGVRICKDILELNKASKSLFQKYIELTWMLYFLLLFKDEKIYNFLLNKKFLIILFSFYLIYFLASLLLR